MSNSVQLLDPRTGKRYALNEPRWRSDDQGPLLVEALPGIGKDDIDTSTRSLWRYRAALPIDLPQPIHSPVIIITVPRRCV